MRTVDLVAGVLMLVLVAVVLFVIIPMEDPGGTWHGLSPYFFPVAMLFGIAFSSVGLLYQVATKPEFYTDQPNPLTLANLGFFLLISAIIFVGVLIIHWFGTWIGGPLLIAACMIFMGERNPVRIVPTALITVAAADFVAHYVLQTPLP